MARAVMVSQTTSRWRTIALDNRRPLSTILLALSMTLGAVVALVGLGSLLPTAVRAESTYAYDAQRVARADTRVIESSADVSRQVTALQVGSASLLAATRGTSTTLSLSFVATNTGSRLLSPSSLADEIANATGGVVKTNKGGFTVNVPNGSRGITIRVMEEGGGRINYYRVSVPGKGTYTVAGQTSTDAALTHIPIGQSSMDDILAIVERIQAGG